MLNLLREVGMDKLSLFEDWWSIPEKIAECTSVSQLAKTIDVITTVTLTLPTINYSTDDYLKGQWSEAKIRQSEKDLIDVRIDVKNSNFKYAEKFSDFSNSQINDVFRQAHKKRMREAESMSEEDELESTGSNSPVSRMSRGSVTDSDEDMKYVLSLAD